MSTKKQKSDKVNKPVADERFARMFTDASFQSVAATSSVDEYGRRKKKSSGRDTLRQVYGLTDAEAKALEKGSRRVSNKRRDDDDNDSDDDDDDNDVDDKVRDESDDDDQSSSASTSIDGDVVNDAGAFEDDDDDDDDSDEQSSSLGRGDPLAAPTRRVAVLNCDWDRVNATDLLYALRSYAPSGGSVHSVTIYPSDFGLERMNEEEMRAPDVFHADDDARAEIDRLRSDQGGFEVEERVEAPRDDAPALNDTAATRKSSAAATIVEQDDSDDERQNAARGEQQVNEHFDENDSDAESENVDDVELEDEDALPEISSSVDTDESDDSSDLAMKALFEGTMARQRMGGKGVEDDGMFDQTKLRRYQRDRLKYFYAIAEFDSPATAAAVKKECQSVELEATANVFELRFVPDDMTFDDRDPRETATTVPELYKPPRWYTPAVAHTVVSLTWDEADRNRTALTTRQWTVQDLVNEEQFANLLPGSEDGSEFSSAGDLGALLKHNDDEEESSEVSSATRASRLKELRSKARKARIRKRYAALLQGGSAEGGGGKDDDDDDSGSEEMEITFQSGFSDKAAALLEARDDEKARAERTWWEVQQEKQTALKSVRHRAKVEATAKGLNEEQMRAFVIAEVQRAKKDAAAVNSRNPFESFEQGFEDAPQEFADDAEDREANPKLSRRDARREARKRERKERRSTKKPSAAEVEERQRARDELALVMMPNGDGEREANEGFSVKGLLQAENKKRHGKKARDTDHGPVSNFEFDVADTRFAAVLENPAFAIDPNEPAFIDTAGMRDVMSKRAERQAQLRDRDAAERQRRRDANRSARGVGGGAAVEEAAAASKATAPSSAAVNMLIAGIKQRSLGADRLKRPQSQAATEDGEPKRPRLLSKRPDRR